MKNAISIIALAAMLAGCATNPKDIEAAYVSTVSYEGMSCAQLIREAEAVSMRAAQVTGQQKKQAGSDAAMVGVSLVLFWPALFFIGGDKGTAAEISRLKGEMNAIEKVNRAKNCGIQFAS